MAEAPSDERLLATFLDLVRIDSPSGREGQAAAYAEGALREIGLDVRFDDSSSRTGSEVGNLLADLRANAPGASLVLSAHLDCVQPCEGVSPVIEDGVVRSAGETVLGADDKAGVAAIIEALRRVVDDGRPHGPIRVLLTTSEELGLRGAKALDPAEVRGELCLVLDAEGEVGGIVTSSPTHHTFVATFTGRASHAGVAPELGVSALVMAADAVSRMRLGRLDEETTANIGTISGGSATNVVAPSAVVTGECRSRDAAKAQSVLEEMDRLMREAAAAAGGAVDVVWTREYAGARFDDGDPLLALVESACADAGVTPRRFGTGGGSDGNIFAADGVPTLVMSCGMTDVHGTAESIRTSELAALARVVEAVIARAAVPR